MHHVLYQAVLVLKLFNSQLVHINLVELKHLWACIENKQLSLGLLFRTGLTHLC